MSLVWYYANKNVEVPNICFNFDSGQRPVRQTHLGDILGISVVTDTFPLAFSLVSLVVFYHSLTIFLLVSLR